MLHHPTHCYVCFRLLFTRFSHPNPRETPTNVTGKKTTPTNVPQYTRAENPLRRPPLSAHSTRPGAENTPLCAGKCVGRGGASHVARRRLSGLCRPPRYVAARVFLAAFHLSFVLRFPICASFRTALSLCAASASLSLSHFVTVCSGCYS